MNAGAMPFLASKAVRAFAYTAIFMPKNPEAIDVTAPSRKAMVENAPL